MISVEEVLSAVGLLDEVAETLTRAGRFSDSGKVYAGRQAIRALWTELHPELRPAPVTAPPHEAPAESPG